VHLQEILWEWGNAKKSEGPDGCALWPLKQIYCPVELLKLTLFVSKFSVVEGEGDDRLPCYVKLRPTPLLAPTHCLQHNNILMLLLQLLFYSLSAHFPLDPSLLSSPPSQHNTSPMSSAKMCCPLLLVLEWDLFPTMLLQVVEDSQHIIWPNKFLNVARLLQIDVIMHDLWTSFKFASSWHVWSWKFEWRNLPFLSLEYFHITDVCNAITRCHQCNLVSTSGLTEWWVSW